MNADGPSVQRKKRPLVRLLEIVSMSAVIGLIAFIGGGYFLYVNPRDDAPEKADAIFVLGGSHDGREEFALSLAEQGYAPQVVFSNPYDTGTYAQYNFAEDGYMQKLCGDSYTFLVTCFRPDPATTRGEGRELARLANEQSWKKVLVVTFTPHISRAEYIIGKCWQGDIKYVASPTELSTVGWAWNYVYQTGGFLRAFTESC